jgi:hypothetical protein
VGRAEGIPELFVAELHELRLIGAVIITFQDEKT